MSHQGLQLLEQEHEFFIARLAKIKSHIRLLKEYAVYDGMAEEELKDIEKSIDKFALTFGEDLDARD